VLGRVRAAASRAQRKPLLKRFSGRLVARGQSVHWTLEVAGDKALAPDQHIVAQPGRLLTQACEGGVAMKIVTLDPAPASHRILALKSNLRTLEEALGAILDLVGNDDYALDEDMRDELMRLVGHALVMAFSLMTAFDELQACFPL
jgi:hypothetical protein